MYIHLFGEGDCQQQMPSKGGWKVRETAYNQIQTQNNKAILYDRERY